MAKGTVTTDLLGSIVQFDTMVNEELSEKFGVIRGVFIEDGKPVYIVRLNVTGRLTGVTSAFFRVVQ